VRAHAAASNLEAAKTALAELAGITAVVATLPLRAATSLASGWVAMASDDRDDARRHFEDAVDQFLRANAPYEVARARIELARALAALGRTDDAALEARRAIDVLTELKAGLEISRAHLLLDSLPKTTTVPGALPRARSDSGLTVREVEVLRLVADGLTNQAIAEKALRQRPYGSPPPGEHPQQAQRVLTSRCGRTGRTSWAACRVAPRGAGHRDPFRPFLPSGEK
jgi:DNA-binding NarL/FixJ family response regulator